MIYFKTFENIFDTLSEITIKEEFNLIDFDYLFDGLELINLKDNIEFEDANTMSINYLFDNDIKNDSGRWIYYVNFKSTITKNHNIYNVKVRRELSFEGQGTLEYVELEPDIYTYDEQIDSLENALNVVDDSISELNYSDRSNRVSELIDTNYDELEHTNYEDDEM